MSRIFFATTLAVVSNVGVFASAGESLPQGSGTSFRVPQSMIEFLSDESRIEADLKPVRSCPPTSIDGGLSSELSIEPYLRLPPSIVEETEPTTATPDLTPIPLPAGVWTGSAGLLALAAARIYRRLRRHLH
jgi:hypothetical protein